jgi:flagellar protein FliO/FliZ
VKKLLLIFILLGSQMAFSADPVEEISNNPPIAEVQTELAAPQAVATTTTIESEKQIPVQLEPAKKAESQGFSAKKAIMGFAMILIMAFGGVFLVRKYRFSNQKASVQQIKILTQHYLGPKKSLAIVRVAGESILIGITDHNISMIKSLALLDEEIPEETPVKFDSVFNETSEANAETTEDEDFAISGIKDFVSSKLKNMRSI